MGSAPVHRAPEAWRAHLKGEPEGVGYSKEKVLMVNEFLVFAVIPACPVASGDSPRRESFSVNNPLTPFPKGE